MVLESALAVPLLFFLNSFNPIAKIRAFFEVKKPIPVVVPVVVPIVLDGPYYDKILFGLLDKYEPARKSCLIMTDLPIKSMFATVYWPKPMEEAPAVGHNTYGAILLIDSHKGNFRTWILKYCSEVLVYGGVLAIVRDGKIVSVIEKE